MSMIRHGDGFHVVRPDRVYRTSVLTAIPGYQPGPDVQAVAAAFTSAGTALQIPTAGMALSGAAPLNAFQRFKIRWQAMRAEKRARRMLDKLARLGVRPTAPVSGLHGPEPARQGQALLAAQISVGMRPTPLPVGARTRLQAAAAIFPEAVGLPANLSQQAVAGSPTYVSSRAATYGFNNWANPRRNWFDY